ncbi:hypothetical protein Sinac_6098 [Singulisphaera acidiphila DSM 18658]|uniref:Uncharacterized protein n=1 Tax=Singulisphaera acidiphila (strain ATCC BAA-1392 / DSM 18658 / VKM B-2454 / MOB10) TaxID=886293 RepID=L0DMY6_SINAD|nr:hypothetical protein Sinac_6098 [Singulisphaera acidiphila DSM 18658]
MYVRIAGGMMVGRCEYSYRWPADLTFGSAYFRSRIHK